MWYQNKVAIVFYHLGVYHILYLMSDRLINNAVSSIVILPVYILLCASYCIHILILKCFFGPEDLS